MAFEFVSLEKGRLRRTANDRAGRRGLRRTQPSIFSGPGGGQGTYDAKNTVGGLMMPQFNLSTYPEVFQIFQTGRRIVPFPENREPLAIR